MNEMTEGETEHTKNRVENDTYEWTIHFKYTLVVFAANWRDALKFCSHPRVLYLFLSFTPTKNATVYVFIYESKTNIA